MTEQQQKQPTTDKSNLQNGDPYWAATRPIYIIIDGEGNRQVVKLSKKRQKLLKKMKAKCEHCGHPEAETGWTIKRIPEYLQTQPKSLSEAEHGMDEMHICPNCARGNLVRIEW